MFRPPAMQSGTHRVGVVAELPRVLLGLGVDPAPVLAASGVPPELLRDTENRISFGMLGSLVHEAAAASGCPHIMVLVGLQGGAHSLGVVGRLMVTAPTLREAILDLCVNQVRYINGAVTYLTIHDGVGFWGYAVQAPPLRGIGGILDGAIGVGIALLRQLIGLQAEEVRLSHAAPLDPAGYRAAFGVPVVFDAEQSCVVVPAAILDMPVKTAEPVLRKILQRQVSEYWARIEPSMAEQTRRLLAAHVTAGEPTLELAAAALGIGPRTLNRRLQAEGTSFRAVLGEVRYNVAQQLLGTTRLPVTEIGVALGYASPPGFVRAFRRVAGLPPREWRRMQAGQA
jgi:AraC-like DNA-binding protein